ncbi:MAG: hypothetical protein IH956_01315 [Chloroflexi bacterium]|nr:hypothetical protein [Chloroflexota bacterium]
MTTIDQAIVEEAAILTAIGIGTAFGLLVLLIVVVAVVRVSSEFVLERVSGRAAAKAVQEEAESRNRAHAAVAAVTAIMAARTRAGTAGGDQG